MSWTIPHSLPFWWVVLQPSNNFLGGLWHCDLPTLITIDHQKMANDSEFSHEIWWFSIESNTSSELPLSHRCSSRLLRDTVLESDPLGQGNAMTCGVRNRIPDAPERSESILNMIELYWFYGICKKHVEQYVLYMSGLWMTVYKSLIYICIYIYICT